MVRDMFYQQDAIKSFYEGCSNSIFCSGQLRLLKRHNFCLNDHHCGNAINDIPEMSAIQEQYFAG